MSVFCLLLLCILNKKVVIFWHIMQKQMRTIEKNVKQSGSNLL
nr:MAG TPA: hypothetical protein [Caudoviricetes sp.]